MLHILDRVHEYAHNLFEVRVHQVKQGDTVLAACAVEQYRLFSFRSHFTYDFNSFLHTLLSDYIQITACICSARSVPTASRRVNCCFCHDNKVFSSTIFLPITNTRHIAVYSTFRFVSNTSPIRMMKITSPGLASTSFPNSLKNSLSTVYQIIAFMLQSRNHLLL